MLNPLEYLKQVSEETRKVSWPTRQQTQDKTALVIAICLLLGAYVGVLDYAFQRLMAVLL